MKARFVTCSLAADNRRSGRFAPYAERSIWLSRTFSYSHLTTSRELCWKVQSAPRR